MLAEDNKLAVRSLTALEEKLRSWNLHPIIFTGHTGWTDDLDFAFAHTDQICNSWFKQKPHDLSSPVIKCKKTPRKKCSFVAERREKR